MNFFTSIFLGIVQGLTEFLPISSSGHLVLAQKFISGYTTPGVLFEVILHAGTLVAVAFYFRKKLFSLKFEYLLLLLLGTLPAVIAGLLFSDFFEGLFKSYRFLGIGFIISGILNLLTDRLPAKRKGLNKMDSLIIGVWQVVAIVPSISRSGSTIFGGVMRGVDRKEAAEFSFLLSIPAIIGANIVEVAKYAGGSEVSDISVYFVGFLAAMFTGYFSIKAVYFFLLSKNFKVFAYYCLVLGVVTLIFF